MGQAIEDASIIQAVLKECRGVTEVPNALRVYSELMNLRGRRVIESSREMGRLLLGERGLNREQLRDLMKPMWDFIYQWDAQKAVEDAVQQVRQARVVSANT